MAVVSKIATIKYDNGLGSTKTFTMTAAVQDTAAGSSVVVTTARVDAGAIPPADPDTLLLEWVDDTGAVIKSVSRSNPNAFPYTDTFFFTANGNSGGGNRCGTVELRMRVTKTTGGPTATYDTRSDGTPDTPPSTFTTTQRDRGYTRGSTTLVQAISNIALGGGKNSPAEYPESLFVRLTFGDQSYKAIAVTVALNNGGSSGATDSTTSATRDVTFATEVTNRYPAAVTTIGMTVTVPNATLGTGLPAFPLTSTTTDTINVDPRLTVAHLLQMNDSSYGTPPLTKNSTTGQRLITDLGFISQNIRAARGTVSGAVTTHGVNGLSTHLVFQDSAQLTAATTEDDTSGTQGGEAGWDNAFTQWSAALPGGTWNKTVSLTAPSNITGAAYLLNNTISYTLIAADPAVRMVITCEPKDYSGTVFTAGMALSIRLNLFNTDIKKLVPIDASTAGIVLKRWNKVSELEEFFDSDKTWKPLIVGGVEQASYVWTTVDAAGDANIKKVEFTTADTTGWTNSEITVVGLCHKDGTPYTVMQMLVVVDGKNRHDVNAVDPTGLFM